MTTRSKYSIDRQPLLSLTLTAAILATVGLSEAQDIIRDSIRTEFSEPLFPDITADPSPLGMSKPQPFSLEIKTGFGYDSNVFGTSLEQDAWVWASKGTISYKTDPLFCGITLQPSFTVGSKRHDHLEALDQDSLATGIKLAKAFDNFELSLAYGASRYFTSSFDEHSLDVQSGVLAGKYSFTCAGWSSFISTGLTREETSPSAYNNWKAALLFGTERYLDADKKWKLKSSFSTAYKAYDDYSRSGTNERKGLELVWDASISWQVIPQLALEAGIAGSRSQNDLSKFDYDRLVITPALVATCKW